MKEVSQSGTTIAFADHPYRHFSFNRLYFVKNVSFYHVDTVVGPDFIMMDDEYIDDCEALTEFIHGLS